MATLSGNRIKSTYQGLLKTTDSAALTTSLKVIEDGTGADSALSLSTTKVKVDALQIGSGPGSLTTGTETDVLIIASDGTIKTRALFAASSVTTATAGSATPTITINPAVGASKTISFAAGAGMTLSRADDTFTFSNDVTVPTVSTLSASGAPAASNGETVYLLDLSNINTGTITLPAAVPGANFRFIISTIRAGSPAFIKASGGDKIVGRATLSQISGANNPKSQTEAITGTKTTIDLNASGTVTGGNVGDTIDFIAITADAWMVNANLTTTGIPGTLAIMTTS